MASLVRHLGALFLSLAVTFVGGIGVYATAPGFDDAPGMAGSFLTFAVAFLTCYAAIRLGLLPLEVAQRKAWGSAYALVVVVFFGGLFTFHPFDVSFDVLGVLLCGILGVVMAVRHLPVEEAPEA